MAQNFWTAIWAFSTCMVLTILISLGTEPRPEEELRGLVYSLTPRPKDEVVAWYQKPASLAMIVGVLLVGLNLIFW
jgi:SSS family solute:Na+ symporter